MKATRCSFACLVTKEIPTSMCCYETTENLCKIFAHYRPLPISFLYYILFLLGAIATFVTCLDTTYFITYVLKSRVKIMLGTMRPFMKERIHRV